MAKKKPSKQATVRGASEATLRAPEIQPVAPSEETASEDDSRYESVLQPGRRVAGGDANARRRRVQMRNLAQGRTHIPAGKLDAGAAASTRGKKSSRQRRAQIRRIWPGLAMRVIRGFHSQFPPKQVLQAYVGIPAIISLIIGFGLCIFRSTHHTAHPAEPSRIPPAEELVSEVAVLTDAKSRAEAERVLQRLKTLYPDDVRTAIAEGVVLASAKNFDGARKAFQRALDAQPNLVAAKLNLAEMEFSAKNYAKALELFQWASRRVPKNETVWLRLYLCYRLQGMDEQAAEVARAASLPRIGPEAMFIRAAEQLKSGDKGGARRTIRTAKLLYGKRAEAYETSFRDTGLLR